MRTNSCRCVKTIHHVINDYRLGHCTHATASVARMGCARVRFSLVRQIVSCAGLILVLNGHERVIHSEESRDDHWLLNGDVLPHPFISDSPQISRVSQLTTVV